MYRVAATIPQSYIQVCAVVSECGEGQTDTDTQTTVVTIHFALLCLLQNVIYAFSQKTERHRTFFALLSNAYLQHVHLGLHLLHHLAALA